MTLRKRVAQPWTVIGIDNGTRLVAVTVPGGRLTDAGISPFKLGPTTLMASQRCMQAFEIGRDLVWEARQRYEQRVQVFIEAPFIGPGKPSAVIPLSQIQGAVMAGCLAGGADAVYSVSPSQWKARVLGRGHGNADKGYIIEWMRRYWPWLHQWTIATLPKYIQQDALDAGGVALYGVDVMTRVNNDEMIGAPQQ